MSFWDFIQDEYLNTTGTDENREDTGNDAAVDKAVADEPPQDATISEKSNVKDVTSNSTNLVVEDTARPNMEANAEKEPPVEESSAFVDFAMYVFSNRGESDVEPPIEELSKTEDMPNNDEINKQEDQADPPQVEVPPVEKIEATIAKPEPTSPAVVEAPRRSESEIADDEPVFGEVAGFMLNLIKGPRDSALPSPPSPPAKPSPSPQPSPQPSPAPQIASHEVQPTPEANDSWTTGNFLDYLVNGSNASDNEQPEKPAEPSIAAAPVEPSLDPSPEPSLLVKPVESVEPVPPERPVQSVPVEENPIKQQPAVPPVSQTAPGAKPPRPPAKEAEPSKPVPAERPVRAKIPDELLPPVAPVAPAPKAALPAKPTPPEEKQAEPEDEPEEQTVGSFFRFLVDDSAEAEIAVAEEPPEKTTEPPPKVEAPVEPAKKVKAPVEPVPKVEAPVQKPLPAPTESSGFGSFFRNFISTPAVKPTPAPVTSAAPAPVPAPVKAPVAASAPAPVKAPVPAPVKAPLTGSVSRVPDPVPAPGSLAALAPKMAEGAHKLPARLQVKPKSLRPVPWHLRLHAEPRRWTQPKPAPKVEPRTFMISSERPSVLLYQPPKVVARGNGTHVEGSLGVGVVSYSNREVFPAVRSSIRLS